MAIYNGKHVVFEEVGVINTSYVWNQSFNKDSDNCYNNYDISNMRNSVLPTITTNLSNELYAVLTNTTIQTAKNGNATTLVSTSDKLFLPAGKEISATPTGCVSQENDALTTWQYWTTHTNASDRIKYDSASTARSWWLRSPRSGDTGLVVYISSNGNFNYYYASGQDRLAPCFAF